MFLPVYRYVTYFHVHQFDYLWSCCAGVLRSILESEIAGRLAGKELVGRVEGAAALPLLDQELEEGARQEDQRQRDKAHQMFISQVSISHVGTYLMNDSVTGTVEKY